MVNSFSLRGNRGIERAVTAITRLRPSLTFGRAGNGLGRRSAGRLFGFEWRAIDLFERLLDGRASPVAGDMDTVIQHLTAAPRYIARIAWPLGRCRPPTLLAMGQRRQETGKACLLTPFAKAGKMGPQ